LALVINLRPVKDAAAKEMDDSIVAGYKPYTSAAGW
jgi:hypothetical protein